MTELDKQTKEILQDDSLTPLGKFMCASDALKRPTGIEAYSVKFWIWALVLGALFANQITYDFLDDTTVGGVTLAIGLSLILGSIPSAIICIVFYELPSERRNSLITELQAIYLSSRDKEEGDFWTNQPDH